MADAKVKDIRKQFEQNDTSDMASAGRVRKPDVASKPKPVFNRFPPPTKDNETTSKSNSAPHGVKLMGLGGQSISLKPIPSGRSSNDNSTDESGRVNVPKVFQTNNNNNNNANSTNNHSSNKPNGETTRPSLASSRDNNKPMSNLRPTVPGQKPEMDSKKCNQPMIKKALVPTTFCHKSDSVLSSSSSTSASSTRENATASSTKSETLTSPSFQASSSPSISPSPSHSQSQSKENGVIDFRKHLRKIDHSSGVPSKRVLSGTSSDASTASSTLVSPPTSPSTSRQPPQSPATPTSADVSKVPQGVPPPIPNTKKDIQLRQKQDQSSPDQILTRKSDGKKFCKLSFSPNDTAVAPLKPMLLNGVDLTSLREEYQYAKKASEKSDSTAPDPTPVEEDEIYWEGETPAATSQPPPLPQKPIASTDRASQRISLIPEMTAEEEELDQPVYDETPMEDDVYDDAESLGKDMSMKSRINSASDSKLPTETESGKKSKDESNVKKKEDKKEKEKKKKEKEEEKKRKKKEEEELKIKKLFKLTGEEKLVGEGVIKQDSKASGMNLKVKKDQRVIIVRIDMNPPNKWLIKVNDQYGYVDSQNIAVDPNIIRQAMTGQIEAEEFDQPEYDDVPEEMNTNVTFPEEDEELIYEECS